MSTEQETMAMIDRLADLITNLEARIDAAAEERARERIDLARSESQGIATAAKAEIEQREELIAELRRVADANLAARDRMISERDEARAEVDRLRSDAIDASTMSTIDRMLRDMIDHALEGGAKLLVEYCGPGDGDEPEDFGCFVAAIIQDDELVRDAIGDTAMEAVRSLRPISDLGPTPDE